MMACMPTSDSCSSSALPGVTVFRPAVPIKSPIMLMSGFRSFALEVAPPKVCVCAVCAGAGAATAPGGGVTTVTAGSSAAGTIPGSTRDEARSSFASPEGVGVRTSRIDCSSARSSSTCSVSVRTLSSNDCIRTSPAAAPEFAEEDADSCAASGRTTNTKAKVNAIRFMRPPLQNERSF